jgi:hypothetical protein
MKFVSLLVCEGDCFTLIRSTTSFRWIFTILLDIYMTFCEIMQFWSNDMKKNATKVEFHAPVNKVEQHSERRWLFLMWTEVWYHSTLQWLLGQLRLNIAEIRIMPIIIFLWFIMFVVKLLLILFLVLLDRLCGLVVRVPGSIPVGTRFSEK